MESPSTATAPCAICMSVAVGHVSWQRHKRAYPLRDACGADAAVDLSGSSHMTSTLPASTPAVDAARRRVAEGDFKVADLSLAAFGRKEIQLAEHEMPGPDGAAREYAASPAAAGRPDHRLAAHDDPDRGADRDAGRARGRRCAGRRCNIFSTQDHAAAAVAVGPNGTVEPRPASRSTPGRARRCRSTGGAPSRCCCGRTAAART